MAYFHSTPYYPYSTNTNITAPVDSLLTMKFPIFDSTEDAYWWVLCTEKYFKQWLTPERLKMTVAGLAMKGSALTWWLRWYPGHRSMNWDAFTAVFLWHFKPEWRMILPLPDDAAEFVQESLLLETHTASVVADSTLIANDLNNSMLDVPREEENHVDDLLVNPTSEDIGKITIPPTIATNTILTEQCSEPMGEIMEDNTVRNQGLSLKLIIPVALDFVSQARMGNSTFRMSLNPFLDERKVVPSVSDNLDVDITGIQHDSRFVPPDKLYNCDVAEILGTYGITTTNCSTKSMFMMLQFIVDFCWFNGKCVSHKITTKGPRCEFVTHATNTLSSAMSLTRPLGDGLFSMGCIMASRWEEFATQFCSHINLMTTSPLWFKEVIMNLVSLRWFYSPHVPPTLLERVILKLGIRPPAKPPDPYRRIEDNEFMVLHNQLLMLMFTIEVWLQVPEIICNELQQLLFLKQLGCTQPNNVKSRSSRTYTTVQIIQLIAIVVTGTFITIPFLLKFTSDMNLKYKEGLLNPLLTYDVGSYMFVQNLFTNVFSWCGFVNTHFAINKACELKWLLIEIERKNFSTKLATLVLTNSACFKLKEVDGSKYICRYITIDMVAACGGINTIEGRFHNGLGMPIKPFVTLGRRTWTTSNLVCNVMFNSIVVDHIECEKTTLFNIGITSKPVLIFMDLEDKIIFRGVGNGMINIILIRCLFTNMLYNEEIICDIKDVEVEKLGKTMHKRINRSWCCYKSGNNKFLIYEFILNGSLMGTMNGKKILLDCHYNYIQRPIVIDAAKGLVYLHHNYVLPVDHKQMRFNKVFSGVFEGKVAGPGAAKIVSFASKVVVFMYVTMESYGYVALVSRRKRKKWDPGRHLATCTIFWFFKFKQWDPGKICVVSNFYNLEDKVDFEGVGNVMIIRPKLVLSPNPPSRIF